jgi:hypothetical protein
MTNWLLTSSHSHLKGSHGGLEGVVVIMDGIVAELNLAALAFSNIASRGMLSFTADGVGIKGAL